MSNNNKVPLCIYIPKIKMWNGAIIVPVEIEGEIKEIEW